MGKEVATVEEPTQTPEQIRLSRREADLHGMVELCTFLLEHPSLPLPSEFDGGLHLTTWVDSKIALAAAARELVPFDKKYDGNYMRLERVFGRVKYHVTAMRSQVCERVVVGKRTVPSRYVPEHDEEIVEWECDDPLLAEEG